MSTLGERIKYARESKNYLQSELAKLIGVKSAGVISNWEKDINKPDAEKIVKLCDVLDISASFLLDYYGKSSFEISSFEIDLMRKYRLLDAHGKETVSIVLDRELERMNQIKRVTNSFAQIRYIQYYQRLASAGNGEYLFDDIPADLLSVPVDEVSSKADFVIGVNGDSMEPTFKDGDKVFVERCQIIETGEIGIFMIDNTCVIKEAGEDGLISHNPNYDKIAGSESIYCVGKVLGKVS